MIEFAAPMYVAGAAVAIPLLLHIAHRRRYQRVRWGAMRFLQRILVDRSRRLAFENWLLLLIRSLVIACLVGALMRPQLTLRAAGLGDLIPRSGRTAAVLVIDDGLSTTSPHDAPALTRMKLLAHAYLDTLRPGDEVTILPYSQLSQPLADPLVDLGAAHQAINHLQATALAGDVPGLLEAGLDRFAVHLNPEAELVLISDGRARSYGLDDAERWVRLRARLQTQDDAPLGSRLRPHLIILQPPAPAQALVNVSVDAVGVDRSLLPPGMPVTISATVRLEGPAPATGLLVRLLIDSRAVEERPLSLAPGEQDTLVFSYLFPSPGSHLIEVAIAGAHDAFPDDDHRALAVEVESSLPVLLVEGRPGHGLDGSLGLVAAALAPDAPEPDAVRMPTGAAPAANAGHDLFQPLRCGVSGLTDERLSQVRVVMLGDVPALDAGAVSALERFVAAGGGVLVVAGEDTDNDIADRFWWRGGDGFLPARLGVIAESGPGQHPRLVDAGSSTLSELARAGQEPWNGVSVARCHPLEDLSADTRTLLALDDGSALLIDRLRGRGRVALLGCGLDGHDSDLPFRPVFVPLMRSLATWLGGAVLPSRNLLAGDALAWLPPAAAAGAWPLAADGPHGGSIALAPSTWAGRPALVSPPLGEPGTYTIHEPSRGATVYFQVGIDPAISQLAALDEQRLDVALAGVPRHVVHQPRHVAELFTAAGNRSWDLWQALVALVGLLLLLESLCSWSMARARDAPRTADGA